MVLYGVNPDMAYGSAPAEGENASTGLIPKPMAGVPVGPTERGPPGCGRTALDDEAPGKGELVAEATLDDVGSRARLAGEGVVDMLTSCSMAWVTEGYKREPGAKCCSLDTSSAEGKESCLWVQAHQAEHPSRKPKRQGPDLEACE